jgi:predicted MPP superfamily phosphohydrolase
MNSRQYNRVKRGVKWMSENTMRIFHMIMFHCDSHFTIKKKTKFAIDPHKMNFHDLVCVCTKLCEKISELEWALCTSPGPPREVFPDGSRLLLGPGDRHVLSGHSDVKYVLSGHCKVCVIWTFWYTGNKAFLKVY